jgi:DNA gyrase/topoisomerase IV subunit B
MVKNYTTSDIVEIGQIEHIRQNSGMYIGSSDNPTRLLEEVLDNSLDEVQAGYCTKIGIVIDAKEGSFQILDNGRGFPFNPDLPEDQDSPILSCVKLFTSGKFNKSKKDSAYKIASGLHGIGLVACNALSTKLEMEIYRDNKHATYTFINGEFKSRVFETFKGKSPFSTSIKVYPDKKFFTCLDLQLDYIEERLRIAASDYKDLSIVIIIDEDKKVIKGDEDKLIVDYLSKTCPQWFKFKTENGAESCSVTFGWDDNTPVSSKFFTSVNLARVHEGAHIVKFSNILKDIFVNFAKKKNIEFQPDDCLIYLRSYINLKIINTSFEAQVKVKLERKSDLSVMDTLEKEIKTYFQKNESTLDTLLDKFHQYRESIKNKQIKIAGNSKKRGFTSFTKLRDCTNSGGELFISEGDSAAGGLIKERNKKLHAVLPLKGVIPNAIKKKDVLQNVEIKEIMQALGCGVKKDCDITKLRYSKIVICTDADPAGHFISALLIAAFLHLTPDVVKNGNLYLCKTPLHGYGHKDNFVPIWNDNELEKARKSDKHIRRFKGLGEFNSKELRKFVLDEKTRNLVKIDWPSNESVLDKVFDLLISSAEKKDLMLSGFEKYIKNVIEG